ncbi:MAG: SDR family NAD(P)-dependent oxidoreductase [Ignavibacteriaceae bacterium]|nr:SDR family NAD(P)-dependent oxidoreductase [Ignavibacteriaceae bacterium]
MEQIKGKIVLITGATSGIGLSCAKVFAREGARLILTARRIDILKSIAVELKKEFGTEAVTLQMDVRDYNSVKSAVASLDSSLKPVDILINNAGMTRGLDKIHEGKVEDWEETIDTNIKGVLFVLREILPGMAERQKGHVIYIGSTAGHDVYPGGSVYCATKFAVKALAQSTRVDVLDKFVKVTSVDPGMVETNFSKVRFPEDPARAENVYKGLMPLTPDDVAETVLFAASRPWHVNINQIIMTPIAQASSNFINKKTG